MKNRTCYYFDDIIKIENFNLDNFNRWKMVRKYFSYNISHKTLIDAKSLRIRLDIIDGFVTVYDGTRYLVLFGSEKILFSLQKN